MSDLYSISLDIKIPRHIKISKKKKGNKKLLNAMSFERNPNMKDLIVPLKEHLKFEERHDSKSW